MVFHHHVARKRAIVRKDDVISYDTVVSNMAISEVVSMAAEDGLSVCSSASVNRDVLAKDIVATDFQMGWFTSILQILSLLAHCGE